MDKNTKKLRAKAAVLVLLGVLVLSLVNFNVNPDKQSGIFGTAASAQSSGFLVPVQTAPAIYVKFDGVDGESVDRDHKGWINLLSFSQGQYLPGSSPGDGASRTASTFKKMILRKKLDKASPKLAEAVCRGRSFLQSIFI